MMLHICNLHLPKSSTKFVIVPVTRYTLGNVIYVCIFLDMFSVQLVAVIFPYNAAEQLSVTCSTTNGDDVERVALQCLRNISIFVQHGIIIRVTHIDNGVG